MKNDKKFWNEWAKAIGEMCQSGIEPIGPDWTTITNFAEMRPNKPMTIAEASRTLFALHKAGKAERKQYYVMTENGAKKLWHYKLKK